MAAADAAREFAPAKVNLYLHVTGRRADGYHLLDSLVVFPSVGDWIGLTTGQGLEVTGPFAAGLETGQDNLILRAARALAEAHGLAPEIALTLEKHLPVASGIGGGSSDAAAALRLLSRHWGVAVPDGLALTLGADVPVCMGAPTAQVMGGVGEALTPVPPLLPPFWIVLVNPGVPVETRAVFAALDRRDNPPAGPVPHLPDFDALCAWLAHQRNDLEAPARTLCPAIGEVLEALAPAPLSRMSGSGATCFGLWGDEAGARTAADRIARGRRDWWVAAAPVRDRRAGG